MVCQPLRLALLLGAITAVAVSPVQAQFRSARGNACCATSCTTAPTYRTITCTEWVRETYQTKRTAYKTECRQEQYDTCRIECVPECRERTVCVTKRVPVVKEETRKVCCKVTVYEERTVTRNTYKTVQKTVNKKQLVRTGHWTTCEVPALLPGIGNGGLFSGLGHGICRDACKDPCPNTCARTRTKHTWVHCPEYRNCPVTVCEKVCVPETVKCKVPVCKTEVREVKVKVCTYECVKENRVEKYTVNVTRKVPCKATRTVRVCVPYEQTVTCCKLVPKTVTRQVADNSCHTGGLLSRFQGLGHDRCGLFDGGLLRHNAGCNRSDCCK